MLNINDLIFSVAAFIWLSHPFAAHAGVQKRVVSLDYCADQYVIALGDDSMQRFVSPEASSAYSHFADEAKDLPILKPTAERMVMADIDMAIRQWGGGFKAGDALTSVGVQVVDVGFAGNLDDIRKTLVSIGEYMGQPERAEKLASTFDTTRKRIEQQKASITNQPNVLYLTPSGFTAGRGTFIHTMLKLTGVNNYAAQYGVTGYAQLDAEHLILNPPDMIVTAFFDAQKQSGNHWSSVRHPVLQSILKQTPVVTLPGSLVACQAWFILEAIEAIQLKLLEQNIAQKAVP